MKECPLLRYWEEIAAQHEAMKKVYDNFEHVYGGGLVIMKNLLRGAREIIKGCEGCDNK